MNNYPKTLHEAIKICLFTMIPQEKNALKNTLRENLIMFHFGWAVNMRNEFRLWDGNEELITSCGADNADDASRVIIERLWDKLDQI